MNTDDTGGYVFTSADGWSGSNDSASSSGTTFTKVSGTQTTFSNSFTTTAERTVGVKGSCTKV